MREDILKTRYYLKNEYGQPVEDWAGLCRRVARALAEDKNQEEEFFNAMHECKFLPNSPALMNAGREGFSMSACFVLPLEDSMEGIFQSVKEAALIQKAGGGTGFDFSRIRPEGDPVRSTNGVASGPCSFIKVFDTATDVTKQGGTRRGANMGILRCDHPDIEKWIALKTRDGVLSNFNLSVAVTDAFMRAVELDQEIPLLYNGRTYRTIRAREIWDEITYSAWLNGEPGIIFIDEINRSNPTPHLGDITATNPCGEQPLLPYEACVLGSVNLTKHVRNSNIDWDLLDKTVGVGVRMLDNIIDKQSYPLPEIERMHKGNRKIGVGVMGWADLLLMVGIRYDSEEALQLAEKIASFVEKASIAWSSRIAKKKGTFPNWRGSRWAEKGILVANATTTTIAPTGSLSIIAECSSGIEPVFAWETVQKRPVGEHRVVHPLYKKWVEENPGKPLPEHFVTAREISPEWHVRMQAAWQKYTHNAVSKTVNLPNTATKEDVEKVFLLAYQLKCKGITVYRDGSRSSQVISDLKRQGEMELNAIEEARRIRVKTPEGNVYVHVTLKNSKPVEVFVNSPVETKYGDVYEALARVFSTALRYNVPVEQLVLQVEKANQKFGSVVSPVYALAKAFRLLGINGNQKCPDCGGTLVVEEGCLKCPGCGHSKC